MRSLIIRIVLWLWERSLARLFKSGEKASPLPIRRPYGSFDQDGTFKWKHDKAKDWNYSDPWEVDRLCRKHGGENWGESITVLKAAEDALEMAPELGDKARAMKREAFATLAKLARDVWSLPSVGDGKELGWNDAMCFMLLMDYLHGAAAIGEEFLPLPKQLARPAV